MNKEDKKLISGFREDFNQMVSKIKELESVSKLLVGSMDGLNSWIRHEMADEIRGISIATSRVDNKLQGVNPIRSFDDLTAKEMEEYIKKLSKFDLQTLKRYLPDDSKDVQKKKLPDEEPLKFAEANDIQPNFNRRNTDNRDETMRPPERRSRPKILSFFGLGRFKVEL